MTLDELSKLCDEATQMAFAGEFNHDFYDAVREWVPKLIKVVRAAVRYVNEDEGWVEFCAAVDELSNGEG